MDLDLARMYGTPGLKVAEAQAQENLEKQAQLELFAKLAADSNIDLNSLSDDQISELWTSTFGEKVAAEEPKEEKKEIKEEAKEEHESEAEEKREHEEKKAAAAAELVELQKQAELAYFDRAGRQMAHAMMSELSAIKEAAELEAKEASASQAVKNLGQYAKYKGKELAGKVTDSKAGKAVGKHLENVGKKVMNPVAKGGEGAMHPSTAKRIGAGAYGAGAAAAAGGTAAAVHHHNKKKESSAIDEMAVDTALKLAADGGYDVEQAGELLAGVVEATESTKIASASTVEQAVEIRALEFLEAAGYPVQWNG